ncbi:MAG: ABC transporter ATP-binding protein [Deltaproteobacteria bacterium]|nr:ABC transporter ATP-binding protein [Deltaproteobacteria bacterium]
MGDTVIRVEGLGKQYRIGGSREKYKTLREALTSATLRPLRAVQSWFGRNGHTRGASQNIIWALEDVSFDVSRGEVVGVIGRNGAGKSTLLKILSRITEPTRGYAEVQGRVGSLLEVGTGFHPELTGRENIYLNGAILGMKRTEIERKFEEIVAFAEVERFIETPVKHYSSGMYLRLAFSVAAHLEPEILLVDEVLAVGDASFQKKCLGKMGQVADAGRTVLFVSHNIAAIQSLCRTCILLESGRRKFLGGVREGLRMYGDLLSDSAPTPLPSAEVRLENLLVNGQNTAAVLPGSPISFQFDLSVRVCLAAFRLFLIIENSQGLTILHAEPSEPEFRKLKAPGFYVVSGSVPGLWLTGGLFTVYAKMICSGTNVRGRYVSERVLVTVESAYDAATALGVLSAPVQWCLRQ